MYVDVYCQSMAVSIPDYSIFSSSWNDRVSSQANDKNDSIDENDVCNSQSEPRSAPTDTFLRFIWLYSESIDANVGIEEVDRVDGL